MCHFVARARGGGGGRAGMLASALPVLARLTKEQQDNVLVLTARGGGGIITPVAPVAYQVILEPGIGQFREFESPRVHTRISS